MMQLNTFFLFFCYVEDNKRYNNRKYYYITEFCNYSRFTNGASTKIFKELVQLGIIKKIGKQKNKRIIYYELTKLGSDMLDIFKRLNYDRKSS